MSAGVLGFKIFDFFFKHQSLSRGAGILPQKPLLTVAMETSNRFVLIHGKNISHSAVGAAAATAHMSIDKLFPALLECFGIIMCGYIAGR